MLNLVDGDSRNSEGGQNSNKYEKVLTSLYTDPRKPSSFSSVGNLYYYAKKIFPEIKLKDVRDFLTSSHTYTRFKKPFYKGPRRKVFLAYPNETWQCDSADLLSLRKQNSNYGYLLVCLDQFSRYCYCRPYRTKSNQETIEVFSSIVAEAGEAPEYCYTDKGTEMNFMQNAFSRFEVKRYHVNSPLKAQMVERVILSIKRWLFKAMIDRGSLRYIDILQDVIYSYNHRIHKNLFGFSPAQAMKPENFKTIKTAFLKQYRQYGEKFKHKQPKFAVNDVVRIIKDKTKFTRGFKETFSPQTYVINRVFATSPYTFGIPHFKRKFYDWELVKTSPTDSQYYIDEISNESSTLRSGRVKNEQKRFLIKDRNNPSYSQWMDESDFKRFEEENKVNKNE